MKIHPLERFRAKIRVATSGCHEWTGSLNNRGYGQFWDGHRLVLAHRFAVLSVGRQIPPGLSVDHLCRNTCCVNPAHLDVVSHRTNVLRGKSPIADQVKRTHCSGGHPFSGANLYMEGRRRKCRTCSRRMTARYREMHREEINRKQNERRATL